MTTEEVLEAFVTAAEELPLETRQKFWDYWWQMKSVTNAQELAGITAWQAQGIMRMNLRKYGVKALGRVSV